MQEAETADGIESWALTTVISLQYFHSFSHHYPYFSFYYMQEAETADGIEFVGEDVSGVDLGEDDNGNRRDVSDGDEDEEELEEIVVKDLKSTPFPDGYVVTYRKCNRAQTFHFFC